MRFTLEKYRMVKSGDRILVAVSGGPDSTALLLSLVALRQEFRLNLRAAYIDHGLRPAAARREAEFVRRLGRLWGVPVLRVSRKVRPSGGESTEALAREVRYQALAGLARRFRCSVVAVGHTQDDQAETVLIWILRGTGTTGLAGMPPLREVEDLRIIRPLIERTREQVEKYLKGHGIKALADQSNRSPKYLRNRVRHELIPLLEKGYNPKIRQHLAQLAEILRDDLDWMKREASVHLSKIARVRQGKLRLSQDRLRSSPAALRRLTLRMAVERLQGSRDGFRASHWMALDRLLMEGDPKALDLPHGLRAEATDEGWILFRTGCVNPRPRGFMQPVLHNLVHWVQ